MSSAGTSGPAPRKVVPIRHWGQWTGVVVLAVLAALLIWQIATRSVVRWDVGACGFPD